MSCAELYLKPTKKTCPRCKRNLSLEDFNKNRADVGDGLQTYCRDCTVVYKRAKYPSLHARHLAYQKVHNKTPIGRFVKYKAAAKSRNLEFTLTFEQFIAFWQQPCYYCQDTTKTVGLDRLNNDEGYITQNVVSCCSVCNLMKRGLSVTDFVKKCKKIAETVR